MQLRRLGKSKTCRTGHRPRKASKGSLLVQFLLAQGRRGFVPVRLSNNRMRPTHVTEGHLLYSKSTNLNVNLIQNTFTETSRIMFYHLPGTVAQASCHIKLTIAASKHLIQLPSTTIITNRERGSFSCPLEFSHCYSRAITKLTPWILGSSHKEWTQKVRGFGWRAMAGGRWKFLPAQLQYARVSEKTLREIKASDYGKLQQHLLLSPQGTHLWFQYRTLLHHCLGLATPDLDLGIKQFSQNKPSF